MKRRCLTPLTLAVLDAAGAAFCLTRGMDAVAIGWATATQALRLIAEKIAELEPRKIPTFTQLSLFD